MLKKIQIKLSIIMSAIALPKRTNGPSKLKKPPIKKPPKVKLKLHGDFIICIGYFQSLTERALLTESGGKIKGYFLTIN
jgi:hypothetical protein